MKNEKYTMLIEQWASRICYLALLIGLVGSLTLPASAQQGIPVRVYQLGEVVSAPYITNITTSVTTLFSTNRAILDGKVLHRFVQNNGTVPVLYAINYTNVSATAYHGILAPGVSLRDGLGSVVDLSAVRFPVSFRTESGSSEISIIEMKQ